MAFSKIPIAIIGGNGLTGMELIRILSGHPQARIAAVTSRQNAGEKVPGTDLVFETLDVSKIASKAKTVFICLPHHEAMQVAADFRKKGIKVIDLSADFRIHNAKEYEAWYGVHTQTVLLAEAIYGLPELHREEIKKASLVASPGCYPTSIILALAPLLAKKMILTDQIISDSKSGVSGAGKQARVEVENFRAYNVAKHRHTPEMEQELSLLAGTDIKILFSPHLVPMDRGILSTVYSVPSKKTSLSALLEVYRKFYADEPFVKILPEGVSPQTKDVRGTNDCHISIILDERTNRIIILSAIDNLTKGASGQAVQAFNLMWGFPETAGLEKIALIP